MKKIHSLFPFFTLIFTFSLHSQSAISYEEEFHSSLKSIGVEFYEPVESWLHPYYNTKDELFEYDYVLFDSRTETEMRFLIFTSDQDPAAVNYPHVEMSKLLSNIATNDEQGDILLTLLPQTILKDKYNAEWGIIADFTPKEEVSTQPKGRLMALRNTDFGMIAFMVFYSEELSDYFTIPLKFLESKNIHR